MIRRLAPILLTLALPTLAAAQYAPYPRHPAYGPPPFGPTISVWGGVGSPGGDLSNEGDGALNDVVSHQFPLGFGLGYRFNPFFRTGFFLEGAPLSMTDNACAPGDSCGGADFRMGVDAQIHLAPYHHVDPWFGVGLGYEWLNFDATGCDAAGNCFGERFQFSGWLFPRLSGGLDFRTGSVFTLGPYVAYTAGQYADVHTTSAGWQNINDRAYHGWFEIGIRGNWDL